MQKQRLEDELADIRTRIDRLQRREAQVEAALRTTDGSAPIAQRPGWPIQRRTQAAGLSLH